MDSIGDYLYLIILVVAGLSSLLKKKKTTQNTQPTNTPAKPKKSWEEILKQLTPVQEEYTEVVADEEFIIPEIEVTATAPKSTTPPTIKTYENTDDVTALRAQKHTSHIKSSNKHIQTPILEDFENPEEENFSFESVEDAKRAFIYSEIFNRKY